MVKKSFLTIALIMFTEVIGWTLILPFLPYYAEEFGATPFIVGLIIATFSIFQFISAPIIGKLSDRYGRKPLLILSQLSTTAGFIILGFANSLFMIFLSRVVDGLLGSNMTLTRAYITDLSKGKKRAKQMGYFGSIMGLGMFIGPALGGFLAAIDYSIPSLLAALMSLVSVVLTALFLKETVKVKKGVKLKTSDFFPVKDFVKGIKEKKLRRIFLVFLLFTFAFNLVTSSLSLFIKHQLGIGPEFVGFLMMIIGLFGIFFRAIALPRLIDKKEITFLIDLGLVFILSAMITLFFANNIYILYLMGILFSTGGGLTRPMITADVSDKVKQNERGKAMGVLDSLDSISRIAGPLIGGAMINVLYPGYLGLLGAAIVLLALVIDLRLRNNQSKSM